MNPPARQLPIRVLLVEDDEDDFMLAREALRSIGAGRMVLQWARTPEEALAAVEAGGPDVCLLDYRLGACTGLELLEQVRRRGWRGPIILLTGQGDDEVDRQAMEAGATDFLVKSQLTPTLLERSIRYALQHARTLETLHRSQESFRELIERLPDGIGVLHGGRLIYATPVLVSLLGYTSPDELVGRTMNELGRALLLPEDRDALRQEFQEALLRGGAVPPREARLRRGNGSLIPVELALVPVLFEGQPSQVFIIRDLTERKQMQARLLLADRMASLGTLAAGIAHEINNPLAFTLTNLGHLEVEVLPQLALPAHAQEELHQLLSDAQLGVRRVRDIVRQLKVFSRVEDEVRATEPVDVHRVLEASIRMAWNELRHRARLVRDYTELLLVQADEGRLGQVLLNLLVNAAQAIPEGHAGRNEVRVVTRARAGEAVIEVRDTGGGMSAEHLERVFEPFFTTKPVGLGTGLGLSICHGIVNGFGGRMEVESEQGVGSTFRVILPFAACAPPAVRPPVPVRHEATRRGRILVVDDEPRLAMAIGRTLQREHEVVTLTSAREAQARLLGGEHFDIILCDLMMPEMSGMDLHEALARQAPALADRMVFLSGGAFTSQARAFLGRVRNHRLDKPFCSHELRELLRSLLD
jgi:PAS domain S-box-containing protein